MKTNQSVSVRSALINAVRNLPARIEMMEQRTLFTAAPITTDPSFGIGGSVTDVQTIAGTGQFTASDPTTGDVYVVGVSSDQTHYNVQKFTPAGSVVNSFGVNGVATAPMQLIATGAAAGIAVQSDGKLLVLAESQIGQTGDTDYITRFTTNGALDTTFGTGGTASLTTGLTLYGGANIGSMLVLANGNIVVPSTTDTSATTTVGSLTELTSTGALNSSFGTNGVATGISGSLTTVTSDASGNLIAGGITAAVSTSPQFATSAAVIERFTSAGKLDSTFGTAGTTIAPTAGIFFAVQATSTGIAASGLISFAPPVSSLASEVELNHFTLAGKTDTTFGSGTGNVSLGTNGHFSTFQPDGKLLIPGIYGPLSITRINTNGSTDTTFGSDGFDDLTSLDLYSEPTSYNDGLSVDPSGRILLVTAPIGIGYSMSNVDFTPARLLSSGAPDAAFGVDGVSVSRPAFETADRLAELPNDQTLVAGTVAVQGIFGLYIERFNSDGSLDNTFGTGLGYLGQNGYVFIGPLDNSESGSSSSVDQIAVDAAGNIYLGEAGIGIQRFTSAGAVDKTFGTNGLYANTSQTGFLIESDGEILESSGTSLSRLSSTGKIDTTFGTSGTVTLPTAFTAVGHLITTQSNGQIVLGGTSYAATAGGNVLTALRLNANGAVDTSFGTAGIAVADLLPEEQQGDSGPGFYSALPSGIAILANGPIVLAGAGSITGHASSSGGATIAEFLSNGTLNPAFGQGGQTSALSGGGAGGVGLVVQPDGSLVVAGTDTYDFPPNSNSYIDIDRYNADGSIASVFQNQIVPDNGAVVGPSDSAEDMVAGPDGTVLVAAKLVPILDTPFGGLARYITDAPTSEVPLTGTVIGSTGSYGGKGNTIANAFDGNLTTFFDAKQASGDWAGLDLGSAQTIAQISFAPRVGWESRMVGGVFQGSNSATFSSGVTNLYTITTTPVAGQLTTVNVTASVSFRYVRYLGPTNSYCDIAEAEFFAAPTKLTGTVIGTTGSYANRGNTSVNAFDGNLNTFFDANSATGAWVGLDLGSAETITQISFAPRAGWESRMVGGEFQVSSTANFSSDVQTLYTVTTTPVAGQLTTINITGAGAYRYVRYLGPTGSYCDIAELVFFS